MIDHQIAAMTAPRSPLEAAERRVWEALWDESKYKRDKGRFAKKDVPGGAGKDLFGEPMKPDRPALEPIVSLGGKQQNLFAKKGLPGQMSLFADAGVPDDLVAKPLERELDVAGSVDMPVENLPKPVEPPVASLDVISGLHSGKWRPDTGNKDLNQLAKGITDQEAAKVIELVRPLIGEEGLKDAEWGAANWASQIGDRLTVSKRLLLLQSLKGIEFAAQELARDGHDEQLATAVLLSAANSPEGWSKDRVLSVLGSLKRPFDASVGAQRLFKPHQGALAERHLREETDLNETERAAAMALFNRFHRDGETPLIKDANNKQQWHNQFRR